MPSDTRWVAVKLRSGGGQKSVGAKKGAKKCRILFGKKVSDTFVAASMTKGWIPACAGMTRGRVSRWLSRALDLDQAVAVRFDVDRECGVVDGDGLAGDGVFGGEGDVG